MPAAPQPPLIYFYGVAPVWGAAPSSLEIDDGVIPTMPVELKPAGAVTAIVSAFGEEPELTVQETGGIEWDQSRVLAHHRVLDALCNRMPLLPAKFGAVFRGLDQLLAYIAENENRFRANLSQVEGCREWGVKFTGSLEQARAAVCSAPEFAAREREIQEASAGKAFILRKKLTQAIEDAAQSALTEAIGGLCEELAGLARAHSQVNSSDGRATADESILLCENAYLVEDSRRQHFLEVLSRPQHCSEGLGISARVTGPWPPYNFVSMSPRAEDG